MKKFITLLLLLASGFAFSLNEYDKSQIAFRNLLVNGGFEAHLADWTASAGTVAHDTSSPLAGNGSGQWTPGGSGRTFRTALYSVPAGLQSQNCLARFTHMGNAAGDYKAEVLDGSSNVLATLNLPAATTAINSALHFVCPSSGSIRLSIESLVASPAQIELDNVHLGENILIGEAGMAGFVGSAYFPSTASCNWTRSTTSLGAFSTTSACPAPTVESNPGPGTISTTDANLPQITVSALPPGRYMVVATATLVSDTNAHKNCLALYDGTTATGTTCMMGTATEPSSLTLVGNFSYTTTANKTFSLIGSAASNSATILNDDSAPVRTSFVIYRFPSANEQVSTIESQGWYVDAAISGANPDLGTSNVTSYTGVTNSSLSLTQHSGSAAVQIACASTEESSGTTCSSGNESVGISFSVPKAGVYRACAQFGVFQSIAATTTSYVSSVFQLVETQNNSQTILQQGKGTLEAGFREAPVGSSGDSQQTTPVSVCGIFSFASAGKKTVRVFYEQQVSGTVVSSQIQSDLDANLGQRQIHFYVVPLAPQEGSPYWLNQVQNTASKTRVEAAQVNCDSGSAITTELGSWVASVGNISGGACVVTLDSGIFSGNPICTAVDVDTTGTPKIIAANPTSATSVTVDCAQHEATACTSFDFALQCIGAR